VVIAIHGGMGREERKKAEEAFKQDVVVQVLVATDAAGEGINLQRSHLMVNYDLPWNPNRLEQRFGRIHRIGQTEVCHLWNLVAEETREGDVYLSLLKKLEIEQEALGGRVFDVLGKAIVSIKAGCESYWKSVL
jgi:superfamily II DNA/RNA helicase